MHNVLSKQDWTAVVMAYVVTDKEGEVFGPGAADLERRGKKLEPALGGS